MILQQFLHFTSYGNKWLLLSLQTANLLAYFLGESTEIVLSWRDWLVLDKI